MSLLGQRPKIREYRLQRRNVVGPENVDRIARLIAELEAMCERAKELRRELKASYAEPPVWPDRRRVGRRFSGSTLPSSNNPPSDSDETVN